MQILTFFLSFQLMFWAKFTVFSQSGKARFWLKT